VVHVQIMPHTTLINVVMSSPSPDEAARIVNAVVEAYDKTARSWTDSRAQDRSASSSSSRRRSRPRSARPRTRSAGSSPRAAASRPTRSRRATAPATVPRRLDLDKLRSRITLDELRRRAEELGAIDRQLFEARQRGQPPPRPVAGGRPAAATVDAGQLEEALAADPELTAALAQYQQARQQEQEAAARAVRPGDPLRLTAQRRREAAAARYQKLRRDREPILRRRLLAGGPGRRDDDDEDRRACAPPRSGSPCWATARPTWSGSSRRCAWRTRPPAAEALELQFAQLDFNRAQAKLDMVAKTLDQLDYEIKHGQARVTIISKARPPAQPSSDQRLRLLCAAPVGVLAAVLGAFVLLEARAGRVVDPDELSGRVHLGVLGLVPPLPGAAGGAGRLGPPPRTGSAPGSRRSCRAWTTCGSPSAPAAAPGTPAASS
jgi:capsular polysaccharide biosynthesis protein